MTRLNSRSQWLAMAGPALASITIGALAHTAIRAWVVPALSFLSQSDLRQLQALETFTRLLG